MCGPSCGKLMANWLVNKRSAQVGTMELMKVNQMEPILVPAPLSLSLDCKIT